MKTVMTVTGEIDPGELGHTQCHEHIFIEKDKSAEISDVLLIDDYEKSRKELMLYRQAGGRTIVDAQPVYAGRMAELQQRASEETGVNIVASTGFHKTIFYYDDSYIFKDSEQQIADLYIDELLKGMKSSRLDGHQDLGCRAGLIKTAVDAGGIHADAAYGKLHTAAAMAQRESGAAVMCHVEQGADAFEIVDFYIKAGVPMERLWLAHMDRANYDFEVHKELLLRGIYLEYDTIARFKYHSDEDEAKLIVAMLEAGHEDRLLISLDTTRARLKSYGSDIGLDYILKTFIPYLKTFGVTGEQIDKMVVQNPAHALAIEQNILMQR